MNKGKLYGVSVGPGDPELLTLRAARVLGEVDCVAAPDIGGSSRTALHIVEDYIQGKELVDCTTPMTNDLQATGRAYDVIADRIAVLLDEGKSVAFITLGDASVYSTWSYVCERMRPRGYDIEVIAGVTSFCAAAARLGEPLCERSEQLLIVPASTGDPRGALDVPGTKVFMKSGRRLGELRDFLRTRGVSSTSSLVANCGLEGEAVVRDLDSVEELPGYMSVVITKGESAVKGAGVAPVRACEELRDLEERIAGADEAARARSVDKWNAVAKPIGSLGMLEGEVTRIAALTGSEDVRIDKRAVVVMCADNGVVAQGVSQCGPEVTKAVAVSLGKGVSSVCSMARVHGIDAVAVDMGMSEVGDEGVPGVLDRRVARGTGDISVGPAMTREQALQAIRAGVDLVGELAGQGYRLIVSGEMSIGNTTTSSAMTAALLGMPVEDVTGRGAGLDDEGLVRKVAAIKRALEVNAPAADDALDVLAKLGGFDIAGLVGLFIGGAVHRVPVVIDGYISALAAFTAQRLCPSCACAMLASHVSAEPAARRLLDELGLEAPIQGGLRLGEGTGGVCLVPLLDSALSLYNGITFDASGIDAYDPELC